MARVVFTQNLERHVACPPVTVKGRTVREVLDAVFVGNPALRGWVLDDRAELRRHMTIFVDGELIADRAGLGDAVGPDAEVYVMQALSGG